MKLKAEIRVHGNAVLMKVKYMDERFRAANILTVHEYVACNGIVVRSSLWPDIHAHRNAVYLRGVFKDRDYIYAEEEFDSHRDAAAFALGLTEAFKDWAENWPGWGEDQDNTPALNPLLEAYFYDFEI